MYRAYDVNQQQYNMEPSDAKEKAIAIIPKFTAFASICGSLYILQDILRAHFQNNESRFRKATTNNRQHQRRSSTRGFKKKTLFNSAFYRLMLCLSLSDLLASTAMFMTTWPIPKDEYVDGNPSELVYGNMGNRQTCTAQGFFIQLSVICPMYNALLALYYYLTIRHGWKEQDFKNKVEYLGHTIVISWGLGTAISGLVLNIYNNCSNIWCWIAKYPMGCGNGPDQTPCEYGKNADLLRWIFYYGPLWVSIVLVTVSMFLVYSYVRTLEVKTNEYTNKYYRQSPIISTQSRRSSAANYIINANEKNRNNERSKAVANQGLFYAGSFALVWLFSTINRAMQLADCKRPWWIKFLMAVLEPSQGFFNFLVFVRPLFIRYLQHKKEIRRNKGEESTKETKNTETTPESAAVSSDTNEVAALENSTDTSMIASLDAGINQKRINPNIIMSSTNSTDSGNLDPDPDPDPADHGRHEHEHTHGSSCGDSGRGSGCASISFSGGIMNHSTNNNDHHHHKQEQERGQNKKNKENEEEENNEESAAILLLKDHHDADQSYGYDQNAGLFVSSRFSVSSYHNNTVHDHDHGHNDDEEEDEEDEEDTDNNDPDQKETAAAAAAAAVVIKTQHEEVDHSYGYDHDHKNEEEEEEEQEQDHYVEEATANSLMYGYDPTQGLWSSHPHDGQQEEDQSQNHHDHDHDHGHHHHEQYRH